MLQEYKFQQGKIYKGVFHLINMLKRGVNISFIIVLLLSASLASVSAATTDDEFKKIANYAREYETGNINYVQLLIYSSAVREKMNEVLGATGREIGGVLKQEQIKKILGEAAEETKWAWSEGEEKEIKLDNPAPVWKKIIFDGKKIQIKLNAWPSIFSKKEFKEDEQEKNKAVEDLEGKLIYRLNFEIEFKKPEEQLDILGKIEGIQKLAQIFNSDSSSENAEALAKESVNAERTFESYFRQSGGKCEDVMASIFGTENKRQTQQMLVEEISFCEGDNFEVIARLEMCEECEWNWINLDFWFEGRGPGFKPKEEEMSTDSPESFKNMNSAQFEEEIRKMISRIKQSCDNKDFNSIMSAKNKLWPLNEAWNQQSNNVWEEVDKTFKSQVESMTQEQRYEFDQSYGWIKQEQEKQKKVKELMKVNYESRKQFYLDLFSDYDKKEYYYTQVEFQKRLVEEFRERGEEICDNNQDDNENQAIDCADEQCGGKICGRGTKTLQDGNETKEVESDFYCIEGQCKERGELQEVVRNISMTCPELSSIECPEGGRVFFSRYDSETNCPIETQCLGETEVCEASEDCRQPACGIAECIEKKCQVTELTECRAFDCIEGDERICESDGRIVEICTNGFWEKIGECGEEPEIREEIIFGNECVSANECGSNNVCSNGVCQLIPQVIVTEPLEDSASQSETETQTEESLEDEISGQEPQEQTLEQENEEQTSNEQETSSESIQEIVPEPVQETSSESQEPGITGNFIFNFIGAVFSRMRVSGNAINGFDVEESVSTEPEISQPEPGEINPEPTQSNENQPEGQLENPNQEQPQQDYQQPMENWEDDNRKQEDERRKEEDRKRCEKECKRPCVEKCIRGECGEKLECVVDEAQKKCEGSCESGDDCVEKCMKGGDWWKEFENKDENKQEKGVFQAGGSCRTNQGKTEGFIWFGGWGEPFEEIQNLKNKYYSGGQADWCKYDFENLKKQRQEFEKGFNQEFITWFFEKYLANSAENWEQAVSGIFEVYWKDVDNSREMAYRMQCLGIDELPSVNLIDVKYETKYGSVEFWEEIQTVKLEGMDKEVQIISPYMKAWVFPPKEFIEYGMKNGMKNHEFPGSPEEKTERKNQEGPTAEEREKIKQDKKFMNQIREISEKYGGNVDISVQFKDYETNEIVFNLYAQVNENDIIKIEPMLPEEVPAEDVKAEIDFQMIYDMIYDAEKIQGQRTESPPWDKKSSPVQKIKELTNGVKMYFKMRKIMNSVKITPSESEKEVKNLFKKFMSMMMEGEDKGNPEDDSSKKEEGDESGSGNTKDVWESKEAITGEVILG